MKSILVLGVALCLAACGSGPDTYKKAGTFDFASFPDTKTLQGKALPIRDLANPVQLLVRDSLLLVADRNTDFLLSVYDVSTGRRKGEFLPRGKGPEEALHIRHIADRGDAFWVNDFPQRKIYTYRFSGLDSMENLRPDVVIAPAESPDDVFRLKDGVWLGRTDESPDPDSGNCRLLVFDESGRVLHRFAPCPDGGPAVDRLALYRAYEFRPVPKSDDGSRIALFHKTTDLIELYDAEGRLLKRLHGPECFFPAVTLREQDGMARPSFVRGEARQAYMNPVERDGRLWVSYSGAPMEEYDSFRRLLVFDWDLNPVALYTLPESVLAFDVDPSRRVLYTLTLRDREPVIMAYPY